MTTKNPQIKTQNPQAKNHDPFAWNSPWDDKNNSKQGKNDKMKWGKIKRC